MIPACETSEELTKRLESGECAEVDWKSRNTRSVKWHRKYFALCNMIYANCEGVDVQGTHVEFTSVEVVHMTLKAMAGLYDARIEIDGQVLLLIRSIAFDKMTADEWAAAWPRLMDVVHQKILPGIDRIEAENEIARMVS